MLYLKEVAQVNIKKLLLGFLDPWMIYSVINQLKLWGPIVSGIQTTLEEVRPNI